MIGSALRFRIPRPALLAVILAVAGGCATAPQQVTSPRLASRGQTPSYVEDQTPMSQTELIESANFALSAERHGFTPQVRNGVVVYCWTDDDIGSRIPSKKCVGREQLKIMLQRRQAQRDARRQSTAFGCAPGSNCH